MRKTLIALVLATFVLGMPVYSEAREAVRPAPELMGTNLNAVAPVFAQLRIRIGGDRRRRRWAWRRYEHRRYYRYNRYPRYRRW